MNKFIVSNAPFAHSKNDINKMFLYVAIALMLPAINGVLLFGSSAFFLILCSIVSCFVFEVLFNLIASKKLSVNNFSFFVTAMVLALTLPVKTPLYVVVACAFFSIFVVKMVFGGLGLNKFNPANAGRCLAGVIVPELSTTLYEFSLNGELLTSVSTGGTNTILNLLAGNAVGGVGTTHIIILLLCLVFLVYTGVVDYKIPFISIISYFLTAYFTVGLDNALINICSGSFLFVAIFVITDPNTSPDSVIGKILYSIMFGVLSAVVWNNGGLGESTVFVVALFVNLFVPFMDRYLVVRPTILGGFRNAYKK